MGENGKTNKILEGVIWKELALYSVPLIMGTIVQQLYTLVDTVVVGRFVGKEALASVGGPASIITMIIIMFFNGLANGVSVVTAHCVGARDQKKLKESVHTAYLFSIVVSIALSLLGVLATPFLLEIMKTPQDMMDPSCEYLRIYFAGVIFTLVYNMGAAIMRAMGDSTRPFIFLIVSSVINVILDLFMVVYLDMGIAGAAIATIIAQCVSAILATLALMNSYADMKLSFHELRFHKAVLKEELRMGLPGALQSSIMGLSGILLQTCINTFGTDIVAGWAVYNKVDTICWIACGSLSTAEATFVGQNFGAKKMDRVYKSIRASLYMGLAITIFITGIMLIFSTPIYGIFSKDPKVIAYGIYMFRFLAPFYLIGIFMDNISGGLRGMGDVFWPTIFTFGGMIFVRIPWILFAMYKSHTIATIMLSYPIGWTATLVCLVPYYFYRKRENKNKSNLLKK
ncbi:MAG: MATE family efflux transporter [Lachnospiraceae bacterium]|nr:MATE family efflux transporter [Lachnospiraceae bacterium]